MRVSERSRLWITALALLAALALAFGLRALSGLSADHWFTYDAAFHYRMTDEVASGHPPERDRLRLYPDGISNEAFLPFGLYRCAAHVHRLLGPMTGDLAVSLRFFTALCGALTAVPLFFLGWIVWRSREAGVLAALALAVMPAHVTRTLPSLYRFDALGTLLITLNLLAVTITLVTQRPRRRLVAAAAAAITLLAALAVWRVGVAFFVMSSGLLVLLLLGKRARASAGLASLSLALGFLAAGTLPYFREQTVLLSRAAAPALWAGLAGFAASRWLRERGAGRAIPIVVAIFGIALLLMRLLPETPFDAEEGRAAATLLTRVGLAGPDAFTVQLYENVQELTPPGWRLLVSAGGFSWAVLLAAVAIAASALSRRAGPAERTAPVIFIALLGAVWLLGTLQVERSKVLAAVPIALACGGVAQPAGRFASRIARAAAALVIAVAMAATAGESARLARALTLDADPSSRRICGWIAAHVPRDEGVLADWGIGYLLQTYAGRPTFTDGHLELAANRDRILATSRAMVAEDERILARLCAEHGIRHVLLNAAWNWLPFAYLGLAERVPANGVTISLPPDANRTTIYRLFEAPERSAAFVEVHRTGPWRVLRLR